MASSLARAEAAWLEGDRYAVAKATEGTLPLALERKAILAKLGVRSRREAARVAAERKIHHADGAPVSGR